MDNPKNDTLTEREEMYLITLAHLGEMGMREPISLSHLADALDVQPISANEMVHKLEESNLVHYVPYKGVSLEPMGRQRAQSILRSRRLWEVFFVENLGLSLKEADEMACDLEHATPPYVADRLADFLNEPMHSPSGFLIPHTNNVPLVGQPLTAFKIGASLRVTALPSSTPVHTFLKDQGMQIDSVIRVIAIGHREERLLELHGDHLQISGEIAAQIIVQPIDNHD